MIILNQNRNDSKLFKEKSLNKPRTSIKWIVYTTETLTVLFISDDIVILLIASE